MTTAQEIINNDENTPGIEMNTDIFDKNNGFFKRKRKMSPHKLESINEQFKKDEEPIDLKLKEINKNDTLSSLFDKPVLSTNQNIQNLNKSFNCVLNAQSQKFLNLIALQHNVFSNNNKEDLVNKQFIRNSMNLLMQNIPAPSSDMSNFASVNLAFNAVLVHALNFQQCVDSYLQQLQESLAVTAYEKHIAACVAAAVNTTNGLQQQTNLSQSDSSSSPNNSSELFNKSTQDTSVVDLSYQEDLKSFKGLQNDNQSTNNVQNIPRPKKNSNRRSGATVMINGLPVKKSNFRGTSEEENEIDPNFKPIELDNGRIVLSEKYPMVTLPSETLNSLIVKSSASATRLIRLLMKSFFIQEELAASSLSGEGIYKKRLDPNVTEAIKCFIRKRHPLLKTGSINLCMTDVCVQARRVSNNQRSRTQPSSVLNGSSSLNGDKNENSSSYSPSSEPPHNLTVHDSLNNSSSTEPNTSTSEMEMSHAEPNELSKPSQSESKYDKTPPRLDDFHQSPQNEDK